MLRCRSKLPLTVALISGVQLCFNVLLLGLTLELLDMSSDLGYLRCLETMLTPEVIRQFGRVHRSREFKRVNRLIDCDVHTQLGKCQRQEHKRDPERHLHRHVAHYI
jgi:hypothetical protein